MRYLTVEELVKINQHQLQKYSPGETFGIKEPTALDSCVNQPQQIVFGEELYPTVFSKAAILFEMVVNKHCFYNGNKRTAAMALFVFLKLNGHHLVATNKDLENLAVDVASKRGEEKLSTEYLSEWIETNSKQLISTVKPKASFDNYLFPYEKEGQEVAYHAPKTIDNKQYLFINIPEGLRSSFLDGNDTEHDQSE